MNRVDHSSDAEQQVMPAGWVVALAYGLLDFINRQGRDDITTTLVFKGGDGFSVDVRVARPSDSAGGV